MCVALLWYGCTLVRLHVGTAARWRRLRCRSRHRRRRQRAAVPTCSRTNVQPYQRRATHMSYVGHSLRAGLFSVVVVLAASSAWAQSGNEWVMYGGDHANTRYSTLDQITTQNVSKLRVAWIRSLGSVESQEATPILVGKTIYVSTSTGPRYVLALNAQDGSLKWKHEPELPQDVAATVCCGLDSRGVAYANGQVFVTRLDT